MGKNVISIEEHAGQQAEDDPRRVYRTDETPTELAELLLPELERLIALGEGYKGNEPP